MRSTFARSRLVRLLDGWTPLEPDAGGMDLAERTSLWLSAFDAIRLQAAHQSVRAVQAAAPERNGRRPGAGELAAEVQRVRQALARAIAQDAAGDAPATDFASWHRRHLELQRRMEAAIGPLRERARQALAQASARLRQLALLDETMEQLLAPREQALLPAAAGLLEPRFVQLRAAAAAAGAPGDDAAAAAPCQPGGWLHAFEADWRQALLGELELRLEPVTGLLEALANDTEPQR